jgi:predicted TIM-barrel fold metal-dependent hydrolase
MGMDRVLCAMDYPCRHAVDEVGDMDDLDLSAEDQKRFFQTNAVMVFKIGK